MKKPLPPIPYDCGAVSLAALCPAESALVSALKFQNASGADGVVIYLDDEQSAADAYRSIDRVCKIAGLPGAPDWLFAYSLADQAKVIRAYAQAARDHLQRHGRRVCTVIVRSGGGL